LDTYLNTNGNEIRKQIIENAQRYAQLKNNPEGYKLRTNLAKKFNNSDFKLTQIEQKAILIENKKQIDRINLDPKYRSYYRIIPTESELLKNEKRLAKFYKNNPQESLNGKTLRYRGYNEKGVIAFLQEKKNSYEEGISDLSILGNLKTLYSSEQTNFKERLELQLAASRKIKSEVQKITELVEPYKYKINRVLFGIFRQRAHRKATSTKDKYTAYHKTLKENNDEALLYLQKLDLAIKICTDKVYYEHNKLSPSEEKLMKEQEDALIYLNKNYDLSNYKGIQGSLKNIEDYINAQKESGSQMGELITMREKLINEIMDLITHQKLKPKGKNWIGIDALMDNKEETKRHGTPSGLEEEGNIQNFDDANINGDNQTLMDNKEETKRHSNSSVLKEEELEEEGNIQNFDDANINGDKRTSLQILKRLMKNYPALYNNKYIRRSFRKISEIIKSESQVENEELKSESQVENEELKRLQFQLQMQITDLIKKKGLKTTKIKGKFSVLEHNPLIKKYKTVVTKHQATEKFESIDDDQSLKNSSKQISDLSEKITSNEDVFQILELALKLRDIFDALKLKLIDNGKQTKKLITKKIDFLTKQYTYSNGPESELKEISKVLDSIKESNPEDKIKLIRRTLETLERITETLNALESKFIEVEKNMASIDKLNSGMDKSINIDEDTKQILKNIIANRKETMHTNISEILSKEDNKKSYTDLMLEYQKETILIVEAGEIISEKKKAIELLQEQIVNNKINCTEGFRIILLIQNMNESPKSIEDFNKILNLQTNAIKQFHKAIEDNNKSKNSKFQDIMTNPTASRKRKSDSKDPSLSSRNNNNNNNNDDNNRKIFQNSPIKP
jgi:hypothetical protein